jgi:hypothetical protein
MTVSKKYEFWNSFLFNGCITGTTVMLFSFPSKKDSLNVSPKLLFFTRGDSVNILLYSIGPMITVLIVITIMSVIYEDVEKKDKVLY